MPGLGVQFHATTKNKPYQMYCDTLTYLNMAFTTMFFIESILKILAFGLKVSSLHFCAGDPICESESKFELLVPPEVVQQHD